MPTSVPKPRRKKRPALPPEPFQIDPDRPANRPPSEVPPVNPPSEYSNLLKAVDEDQSYFFHEPAGAEKDFTLEPDWTKQFEGQSVPPWIKERLAAKDAEIPLKAPVEPVSSWMQGLYQRVPGEYIPPTAAPIPAPSFFIPPMPSVAMSPAPPSMTDERLMRLESRLDKLFDKLESVEKSRSESNHIEIILFILGGLFLILMLDLLVKQGTKACMMVAKAGGGNFLQHIIK